MIQERQPGELRYADICIWTATGQEVTVVNAYDAHVVGVIDRGVLKYVPRRHLQLRQAAEESLRLYDNWFEETD